MKTSETTLGWVGRTLRSIGDVCRRPGRGEQWYVVLGPLARLRWFSMLAIPWSHQKSFTTALIQGYSLALVTVFKSSAGDSTAWLG